MVVFSLVALVEARLGHGYVPDVVSLQSLFLVPLRLAELVFRLESVLGLEQLVLWLLSLFLVRIRVLRILFSRILWILWSLRPDRGPQGPASRAAGNRQKVQPRFTIESIIPESARENISFENRAIEQNAVVALKFPDLVQAFRFLFSPDERSPVLLQPIPSIVLRSLHRQVFQPALVGTIIGRSEKKIG